MSHYVRRPRMPGKPSRRAVRNALAGLDALANGTTPVFEAPSKKTGKQNESQYDKTIGEWGRMKGGELHKNRRGMVQLPGGGMFPYGLGPPGSLDRIGFIPVRITPAMVNKIIPVYAEIEAKTDTGRLQENQQQRIEHLQDHNAITGVAYGSSTVEDCEQAYMRWLVKVTSDER
jgi:hypothetical protein